MEKLVCHYRSTHGKIASAQRTNRPLAEEFNASPVLTLSLGRIYLNKIQLTKVHHAISPK
jgi:hypothetical protein